MYKIRDIIRTTALHAGITVDDIVGQDRSAKYARPRQRAIYIARILSPARSLNAIGAMFQGRDHSTILNAIRQVRLRLASEPEEREAVDRVIADLAPDAEGLIAVLEVELMDLQQRIEVLRRVNTKPYRYGLAAWQALPTPKPIDRPGQ